jgi:hypothetical protein
VTSIAREKLGGARLAAGQPVHLQQAALILPSDRRRRRPRRILQSLQPRRPAAAEELVALHVPAAGIDAGKVVVHAQQMPLSTTRREAADRVVRFCRRRLEAPCGLFVDFDPAGQEVAAAGEVDAPLAAGLDARVGMPQFRQARAHQHGQVQMDGQGL